MQFGVVGDKDAGEQFFKGAQKYGFDFYSFHFFARKIGSMQALALGDFTVNMGKALRSKKVLISLEQKDNRRYFVPIILQVNLVFTAGPASPYKKLAGGTGRENLKQLLLYRTENSAPILSPTL